MKTMHHLRNKLLFTRVIGVAIGLAATLCCLSASAVTDMWNGTISSDPAVSGNWSGVPVIGAVNTATVQVQNGTNFQLLWNQPGTITTFNGQFILGASAASAGTMTLQTGSIIINSTALALIGQNNNLTNTFNQTGGSFTCNSGAYGVAVGNGSASFLNTVGILNISGGTFTNNFNGAFTGSDVGLVLGRAGTTGQINLSGTGSFVLLGTGTAAADITFSNANCYINFASGATATLVLYNGGTAGASTNNFKSYVSSGHILIGGAAATFSQFNYWTAGNLDVYQVSVLAGTDEWLGAVDSDPTVFGNWSGGPTIGAANTATLQVGNGANFPLVWNQSGTTTTFSGQFVLGVSVGAAGAMTLQNGNLVFNAGTATGLFGQNNKNVTNTFNQTGGSFTYNCSAGIYVGNGFSVTQPATGILNISGGTFSNNYAHAFGSGDTGLILGRSGGIGQINLSGTGSFVMLGTGTVPADITITNASSYINFASFASGATATLALYNGGTAGASRNNFNSYVSGGKILVGGAAATSSQFTNWTVANLDFYRVIQTHFYVATNGADSNPGTLTQPFLTISKAAGVMVAGDICYIREGTYRETVTPASSGLAALPITYCPYSNEVVTVSGAKVVTGWSVYTNGIYQATFTGSLGDEDQIFVDGVMMNLARWPNTSLDVSRPVMAVALTGSTGVTNADGTTTDTFTDTNLTQPSGFFVGAQIHELPGPMYAAQTALVTNYTTGTLTFRCHNAYAPTGGNPYYLFGLLSLLDTPGEWFINSNANKLYLWPPQNDSPTNHTVEAKQRDYGFDLSGKSYINLQGLHLFACAVNSSSTSRGLVLDGLGCLYVTHFSLINTNAIFNYHVADTGLILNGTNNILRNSSIAYSAGNGVTLLGASNRVQNCVISDVDYAQLDCGAIGTALGADSVSQTICSNTCYNSARSLLVLRRMAAGKVNNNVLYRSMLRTSDGGAIDTFGHDGHNTEIDHNIFSDNICANHKASSVYLDSGTTNFIVDHNLIYNCTWALQYNLPSVNILWFNNSAVASLYSIKGGYFGSQTNSQMRNNIFTGTWGIASTNAGEVAFSNNLTNSVNPLFVSSNLLNFQLQSNSPAVNAGMVLPPYTDGYSGSAPDIGAFEYGQTPWTAGATNAALSPAGPTGLTVSGTTSNTIQLAWIDNSTTAAQMVIDRSLDGETFTELVTLPANTTNYTDFTIQKGVPYYYRVRADESPNSNYRSITPSGHNAFSIIQATSLDAQSGIHIGTGAIDSCDNGDWVEYDATDFGAGATNISLQVASGATATNNYIQVRLDSTNGTLIANINIRNTSGSGSYGVYTNVSSPVTTVTGVHNLYFVFAGGPQVCNLEYFTFGAVSPLAAPPIPQSVAATGIATNQVRVTWASTNGSQAGFAVEYSTDNQNFTQIGVTASNTFAFVDSGLAPGTTRYYRVRSFNMLGFSAYSATVAGTSESVGMRLIQIPTLSLNVNTNAATANFTYFKSGEIGNQTLNFSWAADHLGWQLYTNTVSLVATNSWFPVPGSATVTNETIRMDPAKTNVFYQLRYP